MPDQQLDSQVTRRDFFVASAAASALALVPSFSESVLALEPTPAPLGTKLERETLLDQMKEIVKSTSDPDERLQQMEQLTPLVNRYCKLIESGSDVSLEELSSAVSFNKFSINMTYYSQGIDSAKAGEFISGVSFEFYSSLHRTLQTYKEAHPEDSDKVRSQIQTIVGDIFWSKAHNLDAVALSAGEKMVREYIPKSGCNRVSELPRYMGFSDHPQFYLPFLLEGRESLTHLLEQEVQHVVGSKQQNQQFIASYSQLYQTLRSALESLKNLGELTEEQHSATQAWLKGPFSSPVAKNAGDLLFLFFRGMKDEEGPILIGPLQDDCEMATSYDVSSDLVFFMYETDDDVVSLADDFSQRVAELRNSPESTPLFLKSAFHMMGCLPVLRETKEPFVEELCERLQTGSRESESYAIATLLNLHLFSDNLRAVFDGNVEFDDRSSAFLREVVSGNLEVTTAEEHLSPMHRAIAQLANEALSKEGTTRHASFDRSISIVEDMVLQSASLETYRPRSGKEARSQIHFPEALGGFVIQVKDEAQAKALGKLMQDYFQSLDALCFEYGKCRVPATRGEDALLKRMVSLAGMYAEREFRGGGRSLESAPEVRGFQEAFPSPTVHFRGESPFNNALLWARNALYLQKTHRLAPSPETSEETRNNDLEQLARKFAANSEERFVCRFILELWTQPPESRPIESHQVLSDHRFRKEVAHMLSDLRLYRRYPELQSILEQEDPSTVRSGIEERLSKLTEMEDAMLVSIAGDEIAAR